MKRTMSSTSEGKRGLRGPQPPLTHAKRRLRLSGSKPWSALNPAEKSSRIRALELLRYMRRGESLTFGSKQVGIDPRTAKTHLKGYIYKRNRRWKARVRDKIERGMILYENAKLKTIILNDSAAASVLGKYLNNVKLLLIGSLDQVAFRKMYKYMQIRDANGKWHRLETRLNAIKEIELKKEDLEFADIYAY